MDLNYLTQRHRVSLAASIAATTPEARIAHRGLASGYAGRIARTPALVDPALPKAHVR